MSKVQGMPASYSQPDLLDERGTPLYGLDKELSQKRAAKFSPEREKEAKEWIEALIGETFDSDKSFQENLKDGTRLCHLINTIAPGTIAKIQASSMPFRQMENIQLFLTSCERFGVPRFELFQTVDLYESKNLNQVVDCIFALSRTAAKQGWGGPVLGPKLAESRSINWTPEQIAESKKVVSLQYGYAGGANQSGITFGGRREIGGAYLPKPSEQRGAEPEAKPLGSITPSKSDLVELDNAPVPPTRNLKGGGAAPSRPPVEEKPDAAAGDTVSEAVAEYSPVAVAYVGADETAEDPMSPEGADWNQIMAMTAR
ncbi:calponin homology domain-containing protein [Hyaloraphidium curvatum]|nr:calponin homology domain-containing protein [Hyaloraphidium curvatum]